MSLAIVGNALALAALLGVVLAIVHRTLTLAAPLGVILAMVRDVEPLAALLGLLHNSDRTSQKLSHGYLPDNCNNTFERNFLETSKKSDLSHEIL